MNSHVQLRVRARKNPKLNHPQIRKVIKSRPEETQSGVLKELSGADAEKLALNYFQRVVEKGSPESQRKRGNARRALKREGRRWRVSSQTSSWLSATGEHVFDGVYKHLENNRVIKPPLCTALCSADEVTRPLCKGKKRSMAVVRLVTQSHVMF